MKKFIVLLLSVIVVTLIASSVQSVAADHLKPDQGIFKDMNQVNLVESKGTKYQVYLQVVIRNGDDQLVNVTESTATAAYLDYNLTDHVFDTLMGQKEIVTIDNIKYEKVQYMYTPSLEYRSVMLYPIFSEVDFTFEISAEQVNRIHSINQEYAHWKIDYCAIFKEPHNHSCIPIFQLLVPNMTLEPGDVVTHYWTILRELS